MKILFLSTHNLATNPRLVKEINLAIEQNFEVEVICYIFRNWSYEINTKMLKEFGNKGVEFHCVEAGKEAGLSWFVSILEEKSARLLSKIFRVKNRTLANAASRRNVGLLAAVEKISSADWVIGHNPGALYTTFYAGQRFNCKMGFDVEDYHPGEGNDADLQRLTKKLMQQVLPKMDYVSFASPLIMEEVRKDLNCSNANWFTILNYFPADEFATPETIISGPLKLVWFSQNINIGRGLELILPSVQSNSGRVELHLYGNVNPDFNKNHLKGLKNVFLHGALPQKQLHRELSLYDVGLALEPAGDKNNDLAISNKILAYLQAGLFAMATNTNGQYSFINNFPGMGIWFDYMKNNSDEILEAILNNLDFIRNNRKERFEKFKGNNWGTESLMLIKTMDSNKPDQCKFKI